MTVTVLEFVVIVFLLGFSAFVLSEQIAEISENVKWRVSARRARLTLVRRETEKESRG